MAKVQIIPGFTVDPGNCSLRVVTLDFLKSRGFNPKTGYGFTEDMNKRYGGKKLKLYGVSRISGGKGSYFKFSFSPPGKEDTFRWNEFMFKEYWDALDADSSAHCDIKASTSEVEACATGVKKADSRIDVLINEVEALTKQNKALEVSVKTLYARLEAFDAFKEAVFKNIQSIGEIENKVEEAFNSIDGLNDSICVLNEVVDCHEGAINNLTEKGGKKDKSGLVKMLLLSSMMNQGKKE